MPDSASRGPSTRLFIIGSVAYVVVALAGASILVLLDRDGMPIALNEWGDALAGVFSPLAFLWLLYASLSQRTELELQRSELERNNEAQIRQYEAMAAQARAAEQQTRLLAQQARDAQRNASNARTVWTRWYLEGCTHLHHQLIDYAAHLVRDVKSPLEPEYADRHFRLDDIPNIHHPEAGLKQVHILPQEIQDLVLKLLMSIWSARRACDNIRNAVHTKGHVSTEDIERFCHTLNNLAGSAWNVGVDGARLLIENRTSNPKIHR